MGVPLDMPIAKKAIHMPEIYPSSRFLHNTHYVNFLKASDLGVVLPGGAFLRSMSIYQGSCWIELKGMLSDEIDMRLFSLSSSPTSSRKQEIQGVSCGLFRTEPV